MTDTLQERRQAERDKYFKLVAEDPKYGSVNHGRGASDHVVAWEPRVVVDFGCGNNAFIRGLRGCGVTGVGVDFANPRADLIAYMHDVPVGDDFADVVTSFDALEHVLPEDVDLVLAEMHRVAKPGGRFMFSICTKPGDRIVNGETLHPTVRPTAWWIDQINRFGTVESDTERPGKYIWGTWND